MADSVEILKQLIKIPTFQDKEKPDEIPEGMKECSRFLLELLEELGFTVTTDELLNVTAEKEFPNGKDTFLVNGHYDTVPPSPEWKDYLEPKTIDNILQGLGASDDKGSIAGVLSALYGLEDCRFEKLIVQFVSYEDNVINYKGKRWLGTPFFLSNNRDFKADYGINAEPTVEDDKIRVCVGCCGRVSFEVKTIGKEAHSSRPHLGRNAIYDMGELLPVIEKIPPGKFKIDDFEAEMPINAAEVHGGRAINIVPGECILKCERRLFPGEDPKEIEQTVRSALDELKRRKGMQLELNVNPNVQLPYQVDKSEYVVKLVTDSVLRSLGYKPPIRIELGRTDSVYLYHDRGIKTVIIGPGQENMSHCPGEYINIDRLNEFTRVMKTLLSRTSY
jgi:acetylornithine deacetylase/succinyl-diaminopimelate desuccinylase-like protein